METSDTNELLSAYKKYTCIKKPHDYKKIKKGVHLKTFYLDSISKNEDSLSKTDKLEFLDYLEKLIHQYKDILNRGTVRLPTISKKYATSPLWTLGDYSKDLFIKIYLCEKPSTSYVHILEDGQFITIKTKEKPKQTHSFSDKSFIISSFPFSIYSSENKTATVAVEKDIDSLSDSIILRCVAIFVSEMIEKITHLEIKIKTEMGLNDYTIEKATLELNLLKEQTTEKIKDNYI